MQRKKVTSHITCVYRLIPTIPQGTTLFVFQQGEWYSSEMENSSALQTGNSLICQCLTGRPQAITAYCIHFCPFLRISRAHLSFE